MKYLKKENKTYQTLLVSEDGVLIKAAIMLEEFPFVVERVLLVKLVLGLEEITVGLEEITVGAGDTIVGFEEMTVGVEEKIPELTPVDTIFGNTPVVRTLYLD